MTTRKTKITRAMLESANKTQAEELRIRDVLINELNLKLKSFRDGNDRQHNELTHMREAQHLLGEKVRTLTQDNAALRAHIDKLVKRDGCMGTELSAAQTRIAELDKQDDTLQRMDTLLARLEREWEQAQKDYTSKFDELYERTDLDRKILNAMNERELETYNRITKLEELASANKTSPHREMLQEIIDKLNKLLFIS